MKRRFLVARAVTVTGCCSDAVELDNCNTSEFQENIDHQPNYQNYGEGTEILITAKRAIINTTFRLERKVCNLQTVNSCVQILKQF